jgi:dihydroorotate dehydrogenase
MLSALYDFARPALFAFNPEDAHELVLKSLELGFYPRDAGADPDCLKTEVWGLTLANPLGIAAGFDKDARVPDAVLGLGCGFAEVGTTTPLAQSGNPKPRLFRLPADRAIINRLGFNNGGHAAMLQRLVSRTSGGVLAVNIGANKESADRAGDYVAGLKTFYDVATCFTVNISSPNTPGLRDLQAPEQLNELLGRVMAARNDLVAAGKPKRPITVKIAPDIAEDDVAAICQQLTAHNVDAIAVSNTTLARPHLIEREGKQGGGLSGRPLFERSTIMLARVYQETGGKVPLIGIGGIDSGETALAKIEAGATLIQLYSGLVYEGPGLIGRIKSELADTCRRRGVGRLDSLVGSQVSRWASRSLTV